MGPAPLVLTLVSLIARPPAWVEIDQEIRTLAAVVHDGKLICLCDGGTFDVWRTDSWSFDREAATRLTLRGATHLASDGKRLVASTPSRLYAWSPSSRLWRRVASFDGRGEDLQAIVLVEGATILVFESFVADPVAGRTFAPPRADRFVGPFLRRVLATHAQGPVLWIGVGYGEWGGRLVGLDTRSGRWLDRFDRLHYVSGIAGRDDGRLIVSWSMSHVFVAETLIREHGADGSPRRAYPVRRDSYYQRVAYSSADRALYAIEVDHLVTLRAGLPTPIARLSGRLYEREPMAIGIAPGVVALLPVGRQRLAIVPSEGMPSIVLGGQLSRLRRG